MAYKNPHVIAIKKLKNKGIVKSIFFVFIHKPTKNGKKVKISINAKVMLFLYTNPKMEYQRKKINIFVNFDIFTVQTRKATWVTSRIAKIYL